MSKRKILIIILIVLAIALIVVISIIIFGEKRLPEKFTDYTLDDFIYAYNNESTEDENIGETTTFIFSDNVDNEIYHFENKTKIEAGIIKDNNLIGTIGLTFSFLEPAGAEEFGICVFNLVNVSTLENTDNSNEILEKTGFYDESNWCSGYEGIYSYNDMIYQFNVADYEATFLIFLGYR